MGRKKLKTFTADDAGDSFIPSVKTLKGADVDEASDEKMNGKEENPAGSDAEVLTPDTLSSHVEDQTADRDESEEPKTVSTKQESKAENESPEKDPKAKDASEGDDGETSDSLVQLVGFCLGQEEFGIDIRKVQEINRMVEITSVPRTPEFVMGVINLRGKVIPVINLRSRFGLPPKDRDKNTRIIVVEVQNRVMGILVDSVSEVLRIPASTIVPPPDIVAGVDTDYIRGVGKLKDRLLILLDMDKIISQEEVDRLE